MDLAAVYQKRLHLQQAVFTQIDHNDAMVATVYKIVETNGMQYILKICAQDRHYFREVYFLKYFLSKNLPVPRIIQLIQPERNMKGAILMECLPGAVLKVENLTSELAYTLGTMLAYIHLQRCETFKDFAYPQDLEDDLKIQFALKFEEDLVECHNLLSESLIEKCRHYFEEHLHFLDAVDGPCVTHRDFRPGNVIVDQGQIKGIIDWSSGRSGFAEEDFSLLEHGVWSIHPQSRDPFLMGYESIRSIPSYSKIMPLLRLNKAIGTIGFMHKRKISSGIHADLFQFNLHFIEKFFSSTQSP